MIMTAISLNCHYHSCHEPHWIAVTETLCKIKIRMTSLFSNSCTCANLSIKSATATHFGILWDFSPRSKKSKMKSSNLFSIFKLQVLNCLGVALFKYNSSKYQILTSKIQNSQIFKIFNGSLGPVVYHLMVRWPDYTLGLCFGSFDMLYLDIFSAQI